MKVIKNLFFRIIVILAGILFVVVGSVDLARTKDFTKTVGTVSRFEVVGHDEDGDAIHTTFVTYDIDGAEYEGDIKEYSSSYDVGDEIKIKYNPEDYTDVVGDSFMSNYAFIGAGALFTIIGIFITIKYVMTGV